MVAEIAREECKKLYEKRLTGLEEELAGLYKTTEEAQSGDTEEHSHTCCRNLE
jgi:hypothetical protein